MPDQIQFTSQEQGDRCRAQYPDHLVLEGMHTDLMGALFASPEQKLDVKSVAKITLDVLRGLSHLHKHNIVHGDVSCENVMLKRALDAGDPSELTAKLIDFVVSL